MSALSFDKVSLAIDGQTLFKPLSLTVNGGTTHCLVGPSGSGKSSLLALACGFLPQDMTASGHIRLGTEELTTLAPEARRLGLLFQDSVLFPHLSVEGNLLFGLVHNGARAERRRIVADALASVDLAGFGPRDPASLSGGQKARVALLRVLLARPRALLLDEPFSALDASTRAQVRTLVFEKARQAELPALLVTHDDEDVAAAGGTVTHLQRPGDA